MFRRRRLTIQHSIISASGEELVRRVFMHLGVGFILFTVNLAAQTHYFPPKTFDNDPKMDRFVSDWYSGQLKALGEPSLWELSRDPAIESYRFLWPRTFHHPIAVRVDVNADGSATLTTKVTGGAGGYDPGKLIVNTNGPLINEDARSLVAQIDASGFWQRLGSLDDQSGTDGSEWVVEAAVHGRYHLAHQWSPASGPIRDLGILFLFHLANISVPKDEIY